LAWWASWYVNWWEGIDLHLIDRRLRSWDHVLLFKLTGDDQNFGFERPVNDRVYVGDEWWPALKYHMVSNPNERGKGGKRITSRIK
jgi:hypothetical protein